jgi:hypothetical protein
MSTHLSRCFEEKRLALGLKPGQLARLAGCSNVNKNGNRIRQFEITGNISQELFTKIAAVLEVDQATVARLVEQDRREFFDEWLTWVKEPIQPYLVVRLMCAIYSRRALPPGINTMEQAEQWAASIARQEKRRCCLVWSRRISCWFDEKELYARTEATPGAPNVPWMSIGNKTFTFGPDLGSVSSVGWPQSQPGPQTPANRHDER